MKKKLKQTSIELVFLLILLFIGNLFKTAYNLTMNQTVGLDQLENTNIPVAILDNFNVDIINVVMILFILYFTTIQLKRYIKLKSE